MKQKSLKQNLFKKNLLVILLILWAVLSVLYISYDLLVQTKSSIEESSYQEGMETALGLIMQQGSNEFCEPVNITNGTESINLININCLQKIPLQDENIVQ